MSDSQGPVLTGGCQCGGVRYALDAMPADPHICHCRMCQKAFGSYFAPLATLTASALEWTRGRPKVFNSSSVVERGFCADCGTPLFVRDIDGNQISIALGSLDEPRAMPPERQFGIEAVMPFFATLHMLAGTRTEDDVPPERMVQYRSLQHPDHDTVDWPQLKGATP